MATKKKVVKTAKKTSHAKKPAPAKKASAGPNRHAMGKTAKKPVSKNSAKLTVKKPVPVKKATIKKPVSAIKAAAHPVAQSKTVISSKPLVHKIDPKKQPIKVPPKKPEIKVLPTVVEVKHEPKKAAPPAKPAKIVIPEIKTKTIRKYEPEFTKSVLDSFPQESTGPTMRYSDVELAEFRELVMKKLETAKKELAYLQGLITRKDEMGGDDTDNRYMTMEDGSMSMEREQLSQMASRQITFIDHLEKAMMRIENKTYGICRVTGKLIDKARLRAVPHATLSIEAKQTMNK
jgi:RNA polymerase-binding transcription factor DksA